jgi:hypothetical protein
VVISSSSRFSFPLLKTSSKKRRETVLLVSDDMGKFPHMNWCASRRGARMGSNKPECDPRCDWSHSLDRTALYRK